MNKLPLSKQVEIISALCEGIGQRAVTRLTGCDRKTVARLALRVGRGCQELHDRLMTGIRVNRLELDEAWSFVGKKQKNVLRHEINAKGDQYVFIAMAGTQKAIISWGFCRIHEALKSTPARALGIVDRNWAIGDLIDAALATQPITPVPTEPERRKMFTVIKGGRE